MESLRKRPRVSKVTAKTNSDPDFDLQESRARNDLRLKSTFEAIFRKYEQDFTGVGDEIDLQTGQIVVNNGHITDMRNEHDIGDRSTAGLRASTTAVGKELRHRETSSLLSDDFERLSNCAHEDRKVCADSGVQSDDDLDSLLGSEQDTNLPIEVHPQMEDMWSTGVGGRDEIHWNQTAIPRGLPSHKAILSQFGPTLGLQIADLVSKVGNPVDVQVEDAWRVPDISPAPAAQRPIFKSLVNMCRERSLSPLTHTSIWASPRLARRPKKDDLDIFGKGTPGRNDTLTVRARAHDPIPENAQKHEVLVIQDGSYHPGTNRALNGLPLSHLHSPQESGSGPQTIGQSIHHQVLSQKVNTKACYTTPKASQLHNPNTSRKLQGSSLKRKRPQQPKETIETFSKERQSLKEQNIEHHIRPQQTTAHQSGAVSQYLVSPHSDQSPLAQRRQYTNCARWTQQEEKLLRHLKENTDLGYAQLVGHFPGRGRHNIRAHYLLMMSNAKQSPQMAKLPPRSPYTLQDDTLLLELKEKLGLSWKDIVPSFPARAMDSLKYRYYTVLQARLSQTKHTTSEEPNSATSEDVLHSGPLETRLGLTPTGQKVLGDLTSAGLLDQELMIQSSPEPTEANSKAIGGAVNEAQPLLSARVIRDTPPRDVTAKLDPPSGPALKAVIQTSAFEKEQHISNGEGVTTVLATPDPRRRLQSQSKDLNAERKSSLRGEVSHQSKSSQRKKTSQSRTSQSTPTASMKQKVTKPSTPRAAGTKASPKILTPRSKAALVSLLGDVTDDEDELSKPITAPGGSKARPLATPRRSVEQGCKGSDSCDRKFCFKCM